MYKKREPNPKYWFPSTTMFARPLRRLLGRPSVVSYFHTTPTSWASRKVIQKFKLADIGEGITECEVIKWSVYMLRPELLHHS
jgi:hypothetical protein